MTQCSSCGGFCGSHCLRDFSDRALNSAVYWQNRYCDLLEIIELFCMDAEQQYQCAQSSESIILKTPHPELEGQIA
jgi:uncharacterized cysteine cluster protein YcgN (CxxCxxCC family)